MKIGQTFYGGTTLFYDYKNTLIQLLTLICITIIIYQLEKSNIHRADRGGEYFFLRFDKSDSNNYQSL